MGDKELYILLSDKCNFSCAHCLNSSGPNATRWRIDQQELSDLAELVNSNSNITQVHFSGGEPSLHLDFIEDFQRQIRRKDIKYAMTTNGWFGYKHENYLEKLVLHKAILSFDKYHLPFITEEQLLKSALNLRGHGIEIEIQFVFEDALDLLLTKSFKDHEIPIQFSQIVKSGRYEELTEQKKGEQSTCPSLAERHLEKVNYIPGKGFTPCCGPIAFDEMISDSEIYSKNYSEYEGNPLRKALTSPNFLSHFSQSSKTICHFCVDYFTKNP